MHPAGRLLDFMGGALRGAALAGFAAGVFIVLFGMTIAEFVASVLSNPPQFLTSGLVRLALVIVGLAVIWASFRFNVWSQKQKAIDSLAEDLSFAIHDLLNRNPRPANDEQVQLWERAFQAWCKRVSTKLENCAFFTRADQLHFDRLGFVEPIRMTDQQRFDWLLSMLRLKFERLRELIMFSQARAR